MSVSCLTRAVAMYPQPAYLKTHAGLLGGITYLPSALEPLTSTMIYPSNALTLPSMPQTGTATPSGPWASGSGTGPRVSPDVLTYSYASRMVYVTPGDTYDVRPVSLLLASEQTNVLLIDLLCTSSAAMDMTPRVLPLGTQGRRT